MAHQLDAVKKAIQERVKALQLEIQLHIRERKISPQILEEGFNLACSYVKGEIDSEPDKGAKKDTKKMLIYGYLLTLH